MNMNNSDSWKIFSKYSGKRNSNIDFQRKFNTCIYLKCLVKHGKQEKECKYLMFVDWNIPGCKKILGQESENIVKPSFCPPHHDYQDIQP